MHQRGGIFYRPIRGTLHASGKIDRFRFGHHKFGRCETNVGSNGSFKWMYIYFKKSDVFEM